MSPTSCLFSQVDGITLSPFHEISFFLSFPFNGFLLVLYPINRQTDPFPNHIATVEEYVVQYKCVSDNLKQAFFFNFTQYIVTQNWKGMHRRIFHWCSLAYIHFLTRCDMDRLFWQKAIFRPTGLVPSRVIPDCLRWFYPRLFFSWLLPIPDSMDGYCFKKQQHKTTTEGDLKWGISSQRKSVTRMIKLVNVLHKARQ